MVLLAVAAIPSIGLASLFTMAMSPGTSQPTASGSALASPRPSGAVASASPRASPSGGPTESAVPEESPSPEPSASPTPPAGPVSFDLKMKKMFVSEATERWCASAAIQIVVNIVTRKPNLTVSLQSRIQATASTYTTRGDSLNGGWGPDGMAAAISDRSNYTYALQIADTRADALRDAATAIASTKKPVVLLAWRGAHAWVMTGYKATFDPRGERSFSVLGAYILDPWYPRVSNIWGRSKPPGAWHDAADLKRNYLPWKRPEGHYPNRDGKYLLLVPVGAAD